MDARDSSHARIRTVRWFDAWRDVGATDPSCWITRYHTLDGVGHHTLAAAQAALEER